MNGIWEIAESLDTLPPSVFNHKIVVPGLLDLATPVLDSTGASSSLRNYFWYRKKLDLDQTKPDFAYLKVNKAKFGQALYVNGHYVGQYVYCFTPSWYEISKYLNFNSENEILIRVGASPETLPDTIPFGADAEKSIYYPGIYDDVEFFTGSYPYIENIQVVPDLKNEKIKAIVYLKNGAVSVNFKLTYRVREKGNGKVVVEGISKNIELFENENNNCELIVEIPDCKLWSPESPFLYELSLESPGDKKTVIFGMREFSIDPQSKLAMLNGRPYYLRGTNLAMHRFFEDTTRHELPWKRDWIEGMHDVFKEMNWNSYRFHVGFAPEIWYEVADEKGFLVQDEYAIWGCWSDSEKRRHKASVLAREYEVWIRERWNHPSVVIWDAQNETVIEETGKAINMVRHLDRSHRPWDNGYSPPQDPNDIIESHPYMFAHENQNTFAIQPPWRYDTTKVAEHLPEGGWLKNELSISPDLFNDPNNKSPMKKGGKYPNAYIINEYGWIWLYRDGTPAWVAEEVWKYYPEMDTPEKRFEWRARVIAAKTEYWRTRREITGIQHFCALTCNRPWGFRSQVSDDWKDVQGLVMQPEFKKYVKPAFSPVGIMIKKWDNILEADTELEIPVVLVNDLYEDWNGRVTLAIFENENLLSEEATEVSVESLGKTETLFHLCTPIECGNYEMIAEICFRGERVFSSRLFGIE